MVSSSHARRLPVYGKIAQRLALGLMTMLFVSLLIYGAVALLPGDFATSMLERDATPETLIALKQQLGLDRSWIVRYLEWLRGAVVFDFGTSYSGRPVATIIAPRLFNTMILAATAALFTVPIGIACGIICAVYRDKPIDRLLSGFSLAMISVPEFFLAYVVILVFAVQLDWFPVLSSLRPGMSSGEIFSRLALPVLTVNFVLFAYMMKNTRAALIATLSSPYIEMAALKGVSPFAIVTRHALRNAIGPIASVVAINVAYLISGVVVVEIVFVYPGIGQTMVDAVRNRDIPIIQACAAVFAATYIILNMLADAIAIISNPRLLYPR